MSEFKGEAPSTGVTRGGTSGASNVLVVAPSSILIALFNSFNRLVPSRRVTIQSQDHREGYIENLSAGGLLVKLVQSATATYDIDFPGISSDDWSDANGLRTVRSRGRALFKLRFRALILDEIGLPFRNTPVTLELTDRALTVTTSLQQTDGQGFVTFAPTGTNKVTGIRLTDCHESAVGSAVVTPTGTHLPQL